MGHTETVAPVEQLLTQEVSVIDISVHFGRTACEVDSQHVGVAHWIDLGVPGDRNHRLRIFCTTLEAAETLAEAFVKCGAKRVHRQVDAGGRQ